MKCKPLAILSLALTFSVLSCPVGSAQDSGPKLMKVTTNQKATIIAQTIEKKTSGAVEVFDLGSQSKTEIKKEDVAEVKMGISYEEAIENVGLPKLLSWRLRVLSESLQEVGKIAKVGTQVHYVTLGKKSGIAKSGKLVVFRNNGEIRDPDTNALLAIDRTRLGEMEVVEVSDAFCKAKVVGDLQVELKVGDEVESAESMRIAVFPIRSDSGIVPDEAIVLREEITHGLVGQGVSVVERSAMDGVLAELLTQNTILFDPKSAQKIGKQMGATHVVTGKAVKSSSSRGKAFVRIVDVRSGEITLAVSTDIKMSSSSTSAGQGVSSTTTKKRRTLRSLPTGFRTNGRFVKTKNGIRLHGGDQHSIKKQSSVATKKIDYSSRDFVYEVTVFFEANDIVGNVGIGYGVADRSYNALKDTVYLSLSSPKRGSPYSDGLVQLQRWDKGSEKVGELATVGPHLIRVTKIGESVTFHVDSGADGPTDDDFETTISDLKDFAPFLHSKNSPLFFSGSGEFQSATVRKP